MILQNELFNIFVTQAESNGFLEMDRGIFTSIQRLIGGRDIIMAGWVKRVRGDRLRKHLNRDPVAAGRLRNNSNKIKTVNMRGLARKNFSTSGFRLHVAALTVMLASLSHKIGDAQRF